MEQLRVRSRFVGERVVSDVCMLPHNYFGRGKGNKMRFSSTFSFILKRLGSQYVYLSNLSYISFTLNYIPSSSFFPVYNYVFFPSGPFQAFYCLINCSKNLHLSSFVLLSLNSLSRCLLLFSLSLFCLRLVKKSTSSPGIFFLSFKLPSLSH
jgi:hypothetical protein